MLSIIIGLKRLPFSDPSNTPNFLLPVVGGIALQEARVSSRAISATSQIFEAGLLKGHFFKCTASYLQQLKRQPARGGVQGKWCEGQKLAVSIPLRVIRQQATVEIANVIVALTARMSGVQFYLSDDAFPPRKNDRFPMRVSADSCMHLRCVIHLVHLNRK